MTNPIKNPWDPLSKEVITIDFSIVGPTESVLKDQADAEALQLSSVESVDTATGYYTYTLIDELAGAYDPLVILGFDEGGGVFAVDKSGFANHADYHTSGITWNTASPDIMPNLGTGVSRTVTARFAWWNGDFPVGGPEWGGAIAYKVVATTGSSQLWRIDPTTSQLFLQLDFATDKFEFFDGVYNTTERICSFSNVLTGWSVWATDTKLFENGLEFHAIGSGSSLVTDGTEDGVISSYILDANDECWSGDLFLYMERGGTLTKAQHYQIWKDVSNDQLHYWYETIGNLPSSQPAFGPTFDNSFEKVPTPPPSCVLHWPLWEEAGSQCIDVSGNENHGLFIGGPYLGDEPLTDDTIYSITLINNSGIGVSGGLGFDPAAGFTASIKLRHDGGFPGNVAIMSFGSSAFPYILISRRNTPDNDFYVTFHDGVSSAQGLFSDSSMIQSVLSSLVVKYDGTTVSLFHDGTKSAITLNTSALTMPDMTAETFSTGDSTVQGGFIGPIGAVTIFNEALSDADCAAL